MVLFIIATSHRTTASGAGPGRWSRRRVCRRAGRCCQCSPGRHPDSPSPLARAGTQAAIGRGLDARRRACVAAAARHAALAATAEDHAGPGDTQGAMPAGPDARRPGELWRRRASLSACPASASESPRPRRRRMLGSSEPDESSSSLPPSRARVKPEGTAATHVRSTAATSAPPGLRSAAEAP
jgi:hypothetical protein